MSTITHPNFKRKYKRGYRNAPRAVMYFITQDDMDALRIQARHEGRKEAEIVVDSLRRYLRRHGPKKTRPTQLRPR